MFLNALLGDTCATGGNGLDAVADMPVLSRRKGRLL